MKLGGNIASQIDKFAFFSTFIPFSELREVKVAIFYSDRENSTFSIASFIGVYVPKFTKFPHL